MQISIIEEDNYVENWKSARDFNSESNSWDLRGGKRTTMVTPGADKNIEIK